jgi:uncharacterized membrane protein
MQFVNRTEVMVPVGEAFDYYCDQASLQDWIPGGGIREFTPVTPPPKQVGSRYRIAYRSFGVTFRLLAEVTTLERDRLSVKERVSGNYKTFRYEMRFEPIDPSSTRLEMRVVAELPWGPFGAALLLMTSPFTARDLQGGLTRFKARVEARAAQALAAAPQPSS